MEHYDYAVIGAGPAGANFARLADSERTRILIIHDDTRKKPCGGLLSPDAQKIIDCIMPASITVGSESNVMFGINNTGKVILKDHMRHCMVDAVAAGDQGAIDDLCQAIDKFMK